MLPRVNGVLNTA